MGRHVPFWKTYKWRDLVSMNGVLVAVLLSSMLVIVVWLLSPFIEISIEQGKHVAAVRNLRRIERALGDYTIGHGCTYPASLDALILQGYLHAFPNNPYTGQPLHALVKGDEQLAGCVIYIPKYGSDGQASKVTGYVLLLLGPSTLANTHIKSQVEDYDWIEINRIISYSETQSSPKDRLLFE